MNERIKKLRKALDLTQQEFADKIGMKRNTVANYETDRNKPSNSVISLICKAFDVNEDWLRTGEGEMFGPRPTAALEMLAAEHDLTNGEFLLVEKFLNLKPEIRTALIDYIREVAVAIAVQIDEGISPYTPATPSHQLKGIPITSKEIRENADKYMDLVYGYAYTEAKRTGIDPEIEAEVAAYRQQRLLEKERASQASSANGSGEG